VDTRFARKISQLNGVGLVTISGAKNLAVLDSSQPNALSSYASTWKTCARSDSGQLNAAKGNIRWAAPGLPDRRQRSTVTATTTGRL